MTLDEKVFKRKVEALKSLPTLPDVVEKIALRISDQEVSASEIGGIIETDQVLSARLLKIVNSSFYGFPGQISSVSQAIVILGFNTVKGLVLSASVFDMMVEGMTGLWDHSLGCAMTAGCLARRLDQPDPEEITTAGLLHDIGKVIFRTQLPEDFVKALRLAEAEGITMREAEEKVIGVTHDRIAMWLAEKWKLPVSLREPIAYHHRPKVARNTLMATAIVHLADILIRAVGHGFGGDNLMPRLDSEAWDRLGLDDEIMEAVIDEIEEELDMAEDFGLPGM